MNKERYVREYLVDLLDGGGAHISFDKAVQDFPTEMLGQRLPNLDHTMWQLVDHIRICQWDIAEFSRDPKHVSPEYPGGYWPREDTPADPAEWQRSIDAIHRDLAVMKELVLDPENDLFVPFAHGSGQTLFREAILIADHNAYHIGQIVDLRMLLGVKVKDW